MGAAVITGYFPLPFLLLHMNHCPFNCLCARAATSDYRQSLQFRGLNAEKSNIQLKVSVILV